MNPFRSVLLGIGFAAIAAILLVGATEAGAAKNPFISSKQSKSTPSKNPMAGYPAALQPLMQRVAVFQHAIKQQMVRLTRDIRNQPLGSAFWGFILLSFCYNDHLEHTILGTGFTILPYHGNRRHRSLCGYCGCNPGWHSGYPMGRLQNRSWPDC